RIESIKTGKVNAVFDEGLHGWLLLALDHGFEVLALEPKILRQVEPLGFQRAVLPQEKYPQLGGNIQTLDFSGWPLITHRWLPNELAYAICEAVDARQSVIPVDDDHPPGYEKALPLIGCFSFGDSAPSWSETVLPRERLSLTDP